MRLFFSIFFEIIFLGLIFYYFPVIFILKRLTFLLFLWIVFDFCMIWCDCYSVLKAFYYLFYQLDLLMLFCFLSDQESLYMIISIWVFFEIINLKRTKSKIKSLCDIDVSNPIWCLEKSDWKTSFVTSSALS